VLIVEDDNRVARFIEKGLREASYAVDLADDGNTGLRLALGGGYDVIVLDLMLPGIDGFEVLRRLRAQGDTVPVVVLTARDEDVDKIVGLELGADDYLPKPFNPDELVARIEAIRRRLKPARKDKAAELFRMGDVTIDFSKRQLTVGGESKYLTRTEWLLLSQLVNNAGRLMLYEELLTRVWGPEYRDDVQILRTWISRLRNKVESDPDNPALIRTVPKTGYMIDQPQVTTD